MQRTTIPQFVKVILLLAFAFFTLPNSNAQMFAFTSYDQQTTVPTLKKQHLSEVLTKLKNEKKVRFVYETKLVKGKTVLASIDYQQNVEEILNQILPQVDLTYMRMRHNVFSLISMAETVQEKREIKKIEALPEPKTQARKNPIFKLRKIARLRANPDLLRGIEHEVSGKVVDEEGAPLVGATVREKGGIRGILTDNQGQYSLTLPESDGTLVISFVGYRTIEVPVNGRSNINITMELDITSLDEVVVLGYGSQVKRDLTGSVSTVKGEDLIKLPALSVDQALQGQAAGVQVSSASGVAGGPVRVLVRGTNSISAQTEPLWIVDGMPITNDFGGNIRATGGTAQNPLASINPNDIESIEILKDAAATAIYGSRGSSGVIIVTTKSGRKGDGKLNINYQSGITNLTRHPEDLILTDGQQWLNLVDEANTNSGRAPFEPNSILNDQRDETAQLERSEVASTNWFDEVISSGSFHDLNMSASKGFDGGDYFISGQYRDEKGVLWNDALDMGNRFQRASARANVNIDPVKDLTIGTRINLSYTNNQRVSPTGGGAPCCNDQIATPGYGAATNIALPIFPIEKNGSLFDPLSGRNLRATMNQNNFRNQYYQYRAIGGINAEYRLPWVPGLAIRSEASADIMLNHGIIWGNTNIREFSAYAFDDQSTIFNFNYNAYLNYNRSFGIHSLNLVGGVESQAQSRRGKFLEGDALSGTAQEINSPGNILRAGGSFGGERYLRAFFGRLNYKLADRFLLGASLRRDGSSAFEPDLRWGTFAALSAGWILTEEAFLENNNFVNFLKIRASFGQTGNQFLPTGITETTFAGWGRYGSRDNGVNAGDLLSNIGASGVTWETTDSWDAGVDFELLDSRISGNIAYYRQDVKDLLLRVPIPPSSGIFNGQTIWSNVGDMRNQGLEVSLTTYNINNANFRWVTTVNFTTNQNQIIRLVDILDENENGINSGITTTVAGGMLGEFFLARYAGLNQFGGYPEIYAIDRDSESDTYRQETGDIIPATRNDVRNHKQRTGKSGLPTYFGGINNSLSFKGLELSFLLSFQGGNYIFDNVERSMTRVGNGSSNLYSDLVSNSWTPENPDARHPRLTWNNRYDIYNEAGEVDRGNQRFDYRGNQYHDQYLKKGDFLRLRNVQLAYDFPSSILNSMKLEKLRIFVTGTNLLTITGYDGLDPEQTLITSDTQTRNLGQGVFGNALPQLKMFIGGINLGF